MPITENIPVELDPTTPQLTLRIKIPENLDPTQVMALLKEKFPKSNGSGFNFKTREIDFNFDFSS